MAIIYSYPLATPKILDLLIGTSTFDENDLTSRRGNPTVSFTIDSLIGMIATTTGAQTLQQVTNLGATTTNTVTISNLIVSGTIDNKGPFEDSLGSTGSIGKFLESTTNGTRWATNSSNNYSWIVRNSQFVAVNKTLAGGQVLKFATTPGSSTPGITTLTGAGSDLDPYLMTIPDTNYWGFNDDDSGVHNNPNTIVNNNIIPVLTNGGSGYPPGTFVYNNTALNNADNSIMGDGMKFNINVGLDGVIDSVSITDTGNNYYINGDTWGVISGGGTGGIITLTVLGKCGIIVQTPPIQTNFVSSKVLQAGIFDSYGNGQTNGSTARGNLQTSCDGYPNSTSKVLSLRATINPTCVTKLDGLNIGGGWVVGQGNNVQTTSSLNGVNLEILFRLNADGTANASISWAGQGYQDGEIITLVGGNNDTTFTVTTSGGATQSGKGPEMIFYGQRGGDNTQVFAYPNQLNDSFASMAIIEAIAEENFDSLRDRTDDQSGIRKHPSRLVFSTTSYNTATTRSTTTEALELSNTQQVRFNKYGSGTFTGTPTFNLSTTSSGSVIETPLYNWIARDSTNADKTLSVGQYLKFVTAVGTPGATALSGAGTTGNPFLMTLTSPDTNTQNTYTAGAGLSESSFVFSADIDTTAANDDTVGLVATADRFYAVQLDNNATVADRKMVVNVPWVDGGGSYVLQPATVAALGGVRLFNNTVNDVAPETITTTAGRNYAIELDTDNKMIVNVPWTDISNPYVLPLAANGTRGGIQIGYTSAGKSYAVQLLNEKAFVNVPWTDTVYTLPLAADGTRGGVQIGYTENAKNYPVELDSEKMFVNVPWTDTPGITGSGADTQITIWNSATSITGNANYTRDASNNISQGADTDVKNTIGRAVVDGGTINSDFAIFTHIDRISSLNYAFMASPNGSSFINASGAGQSVQILDDNLSCGSFTDGLSSLGGDNVKFSKYGSGNVTGTPTFNLSVDSTGKVIETANGGGGGGLVSKIATNSFNATQLQTGGTLSFQLPSSIAVGKQLLIQDCVFYLDHGGTSFNYGAGIGSIIELKFNDGSTFSSSLVLASTQSFMNGSSDNMQQGSQPNVFFPILYGDIVASGGGTMQIVFPSAVGIKPTQGNGELYCSIKYVEVDTGVNFGL